VVTALGCARCQGALDPEDLRCALCGLAVPVVAGAARALDAVRAEIVRCVNCGAAMAYDARAQAPACAFCGSVTRAERVDDPMEQAGHALAFTVDPARAKQVLRAWLSGRGFFAPADLATSATVDQLRPLWWPAWIFSALADIWWTADSDHDARRSAWAPHAGRASLRCDHLLVSASRGLTVEECARLAPGYDLQRAAPAEAVLAAAPAHSTVERFDVQRSAARRRILDALTSLAGAEVSSRFVPGRRARNVRVSLLLQSLTTHRYALPAYVLAYRYGGRLYRAVVHGQDERVVLGESPTSVWRVLGVVAAVLAALALVALIASVLQR
jgi:hypothetical protein